MTTPDAWALRTPNKPALIAAETGLSWSFEALADTAARWGNALRSLGVLPGDKVAVLTPNRIEAFGVYWAALRVGAQFVPLNWHLKPEEAGYILDNSGAKLLLAHGLLANLAVAMGETRDLACVAFGGDIPGFTRLETLAVAAPRDATGPEVEGGPMLYSSGTTGKPKGIVQEQGPSQPYGVMPTGVRVLVDAYELGPETVYLCPAPIYHAAPLVWSMSVMRSGGAVVLMDRFDAETALAAIDRFGVTLAQFVPTHFVRMLRLPPDMRARYRLETLRKVVHAAAPCPAPVKQAMLDWLGPRIFEFYSGSEGLGMTAIGPEEWLAHPGSVGKAVFGKLHILDEEGRALPAGEVGTVYFEGGGAFRYHGDEAKTAESRAPGGLSTLGDMGWVDAQGYLYLTDRRSHMIISGGVNIYPQEVEDLLIMHPAVDDVAVIGAPDAEMGEAVKAVVVVRAGVMADASLASNLIAYCRTKLAGFKCPTSVDFVLSLPRLENGKLLKREVRAAYWP